MKRNAYINRLRRDLFHRGVIHIVLVLLLILLCVVPGYYLLNFIYRYTGTPPVLVTYVLATFVGYMLFFSCIKFIMFIFRNHMNPPGHKHDHQHKQPPPPPPPQPPRPLQPNHAPPRELRREPRRPSYWQPPQALIDTLEALDRIASGDFDVLVEGDSHGYYDELTQKVNTMARQLASMEHMRQDFVSNVSHEIQSPLTSILGFAKLIRQEGVTDEERRHYAEIIEAESQRLSKLSENLLKLSVLSSDQSPYDPAPFRLDKQVETVLLMLEPQWSAKSLELDIDLAPVILTGDEELLSQVWINLLGNAIKFTPQAGSLHITLREECDTAICSIADSGIGIDAESLPHIFERFYKADKSRDRSLGGNGLGLSLVKRIVDIHGGQVDVQSTPGESTVFTVTLPGNPKL